MMSKVSPKIDEVMSAMTGDDGSIVVKLTPVLRNYKNAVDDDGDEWTFRPNTVVQAALDLNIDLPLSTRLAPFRFTHDNSKRSEFMLLYDVNAHNKDFTLALQMCTIPTVHFATQDIEDAKVTLHEYWTKLRQDKWLREMTDEEFGTGFSKYVVPWSIMQKMSEVEDHHAGLEYCLSNERDNFRMRVIVFLMKWRMYFQPRLVATNAVSSDDDVAIETHDRRFKPFVNSPYTKEQRDVYKAIELYNTAIHRQTSPKTHRDRREAIVDALQRLKQSLAILSGRKDFCFSRSCDIDWPVDGQQVRMDWGNLCRWCNHYAHQERYVGLIDQTLKRFHEAVNRYL